jgi:predicted N-acetyltransferase YhbS
MSKIHVRQANQEDNAAIKALTIRCPQEGMVKIIAHRTPEFNTLHKCLDPNSWHLVVCDGYQIIGSLGVIHFTGSILGKKYKIAYMLDLKVDLPYRKGLTAHRLVQSAIEKVRKSDADMVLVNFLQNNTHPMVFTSGKGGIPKAYHLGSNLVFNLMPWKKYKLDTKYDIKRLHPDDKEEVFELYEKFVSEFNISADLSKNTLENYMQKIKGLSASDFLVAKKNGSIKAVAALWDDHYYKSYQVVQLDSKLRSINNTIKLLSLFRKMPRPLDTRHPMRQLSVRLYAHDRCPEALDQIIRYAINHNRGNHFTALNFYCSRDDDMVPYLKNYTSITVGSEMYLYPKDESLYEALNQIPAKKILLDLVVTL